MRDGNGWIYIRTESSWAGWHTIEGDSAWIGIGVTTVVRLGRCIQAEWPMRVPMAIPGARRAPGLTQSIHTLVIKERATGEAEPWDGFGGCLTLVDPA